MWGATMNIEDDMDRQPATNAARRPNYVAPDPQPNTAIVPRRIDILPPEPVGELAPPAKLQSIVSGSHLDRALGFRTAMLPVAAVAGVLGAIAAVSLFGVPVLSFALLLTYFATFSATWLTGYALHTFVSADGVALATILLQYRLLSREQKHRQRRMDRDL